MNARHINESERKNRLEQLYRSVGRVVHTSQLLETQLALVLAILRDELELQVDFHSLAAADNKSSLGTLIEAIRRAKGHSFDGESLLTAALEARNRIVHHFFVRNVDATTNRAVYVATLAELETADRTLAAAATLMHALHREMCDARGIDDARIVVRQDRIGNDSQ